MPKLPNPDCPYCNGTGSIAFEPKGSTRPTRIELPCRCTADATNDPLPDGLKSIV